MYQVLPFRVWVEMGAMAIKEYTTFPKLQDFSFTMKWFSVISGNSLGEGLTSLWRRSRCISQLQPIMLDWKEDDCKTLYVNLKVFNGNLKLKPHCIFKTDPNHNSLHCWRGSVRLIFFLPKGKTHANSILGRILNCIWWQDSRFEDLEYSVIAITSRFIETRSGSTCYRSF